MQTGEQTELQELHKHSELAQFEHGRAGIRTQVPLS